jgi:plasmid stabilization system protein ParE
MSLPLSIRPEAERDLEEARDWYEARREGLGGEFLTAVDDVFARMEMFPESYAPVYRGVRPARLHRFPYVVYYRITDTCLEVLAVLHGSRNPRAWRSRA